MRVSRDKAMMTLENGDTVCVLGGGPGGASCAIALKREAQKLNKEVRVVIFEQKSFRGHRQYNQCIGVLSPPLETILKEELGMDHYEVSGWRCLHRHFYLTQLSRLFCAQMRLEYDTSSDDLLDRITVEQVR
ncbi:MAG: hypothetical protein IIA62_08870, partial [Nitrospinae bacterium]|nr:hypothetical protein [Nitrospinota bacterium]